MPSASQLLHHGAYRRHWLALLCLLLAVTTLAALSPSSHAPTLGGGDKIDHILAFSALAFVAVLAQRSGVRAAWLTFAGLLAYGAGIEVAQLFVPGRDGSLADLMADGVGIAAGCAVAGLARRSCRPADF